MLFTFILHSPHFISPRSTHNNQQHLNERLMILLIKIPAQTWTFRFHPAEETQKSFEINFFPSWRFCFICMAKLSLRSEKEEFKLKERRYRWSPKLEFNRFCAGCIRPQREKLDGWGKVCWPPRLRLWRIFRLINHRVWSLHADTFPRLDEAIKLISRRKSFSNHDKSRANSDCEGKRVANDGNPALRLADEEAYGDALQHLFSIDERYVTAFSCASWAERRRRWV